MELVSSSFAKELDIESPEGQCVLLVRYAGTRKGVDWQSRQGIEILEMNLGASETITDDSKLWASMASVPLCGLPGFSFRVSVLPTSVNELVKNLVKINSEAFTNSTWQLGIADGRLRLIDDHKR
jgi:hypothetical protein